MMATLSARSNSPASGASLPFLFARPQDDRQDWKFRASLDAALAAERADEDTRRNTRGRIAYLLCELGVQLTRRGIDRDADMPLCRAEIAGALGTSLCRVKRTLALLSLSQVIATDGARVRVLDWARLCGVAGYDPDRLDLSAEDMDGEAALIRHDEPADEQLNLLTAAGDPACFV